MLLKKLRRLLTYRSAVFTHACRMDDPGSPELQQGIPKTSPHYDDTIQHGLDP